MGSPPQPPQRRRLNLLEAVDDVGNELVRLSDVFWGLHPHARLHFRDVHAWLEGDVDQLNSILTVAASFLLLQHAQANADALRRLQLGQGAQAMPTPKPMPTSEVEGAVRVPLHVGSAQVGDATQRNIGGCLDGGGQALQLHRLLPFQTTQIHGHHLALLAPRLGTRGSACISLPAFMTASRTSLVPRWRRAGHQLLVAPSIVARSSKGV